METIVSTGPIHCHIEPTRRCNLNCIMCCPHELRHAHRPDMGFELFRKVVDDESFTKNLHTIGLYGNGEPLVSPAFIPMLTYLTTTPRLQHIHVNITTNGMLLDDTARKHFLGYNTSISVSFDGANKGTFEKIRKSSDFERIVANLEAIRDLKAHYRTLFPIVNFTFTAMRDNIEELPYVLNLAHCLEVKNVTCAYCVIQSPHIDPHQSLYFHKELSNAVFRKAFTLAQTLKINFYIPPLFGTTGPAVQKPWSTCPWVMRNSVIECDGKVVPCCMLTASMGNVGESTFEEVWNGEEYRELRRRLIHDDPPEKCRECPDMRSANVDSISRHFTPEKRRELADIDPAFGPPEPAEILSPVNSCSL